ncbi:MAG: phosphonoacetaldehyde hydrolase [Odoribacter sp.]|nr:phosphonoacetaldehyde hydrolase [Odoribacter sp.]
MKRVECIIMDWAGTAIDFGCFAPLQAFISVFNKKGIELSAKQAREPMGMTKIDHIRAITQMEDIKNKFEALYKRSWNEEDIKELYNNFEEELFKSLSTYTTPIPGVIETLELLRDEGIKIGSTTGYTAKMMEIVRKGAAEKGYIVDDMLTSDNLPYGRPAPYMVFKNMMDLEIDSVLKVVKVGDTIADIKEGINSGVWSVGIIIGSSKLGLTEEEYNSMDKEERDLMKKEVKKKMLLAGAHYVLSSIYDLPMCVKDINEKLKNQ